MKKTYKILLPLFIFLSAFSFNGFSQDVDYARKVIDTLCSPEMHGRGYVFSGNKYASKYLVEEFQALDLKQLSYKYKQDFSFPVNTFPGKMDVKVKEKTLIPGVDYLVAPSSGSLKGTYEIIWLDKKILDKQSKLEEFMKADYSASMIGVDFSELTDKEHVEIAQTMRSNPLNAKGIVILTKEKLSWGVSTMVSPFPLVEIKKLSVGQKFKDITLDIENVYNEKYTSNNLIGYVEGSIFPDSFIVVCAHYDHLGRMGNQALFPGANDNASGVALLLNLAKYYSDSDNEPQKSIVFMLFGAEEAGLIGSKYYTENPLFPLNQINFLINLDLVGFSSEGIKVVNGSIHKDEFKNLSLVNNEFEYVKDVLIRGAASNSDHYPFHAKGIKSFFIYGLGGPGYYHDIYDKAKTIKLSEFENMFQLLTNYIETF